MNDNRTQSMLQRLPMILAVTAHSFGLVPGAAQAGRGHPQQPHGAAGRPSPARGSTSPR